MTEEKICFVISPIGEEDSEPRRQSGLLLKHVIEPATTQCGYTPIPAGQLPGSGLITSEIIRYLVSAPLVIADLTGGNANVFYELALRHAVRKPFIQLIAKTESIKFDVKDIRTIHFDITNVASEEKAKDELIQYILDAEKKPFPETPISAAGLLTWTPFPESENAPLTAEMSSTAKKHMNAVFREYLETVASAEATPPEIKHLIQQMMASPHLLLLADTGDDLDAACTLINNVPEGGHISATSSLQHHDADERNIYRTALNDALKRGVTYRKVICSGPTLSNERYTTWYQEFREKAELIKAGVIKPDVFHLLHNPLPMSVDVLISQDANNQCLEMVAGFAGGDGHGGFSIDDKKIVDNWLDVYLERKIIDPAEKHMKRVLENIDQCFCLRFLNLLQEARDHAASQPEPAEQEPPDVSQPEE